MSADPRVLVIRGGAVGDFILTLPALRLLKENLPRCRVEVLGYPGITQLAVKAGLAVSTRALEHGSMARLFARGAEIDGALAEYLRGFNLVVSYLFDPDGVFRDNLQRAGVKTLLECPHHIRPGEGHAALQLARPLERLAVFAEEPEWRRPFFAGAPACPSPLTVAIHPGSGSLKKNWQVEHWLEVAESLRAAFPGIRIVFITGEAEEARGTMQALPADAGRWHMLPLTELAGRLGKCHAFLGHDSGISHLASACGVPCLLLFGPTDPELWAPPQAGVRVVRAPEADLARLPPAGVMEAALNFVREIELSTQERLVTGM